MSNDALSWAWTVPCQPTCKFVLIAIADRANEAGECFPSVRDLVERTGLTDRAIQKSIDRLVTEGWLQRTFRAGRSTIYRVSISAQTSEPRSPPNEVHPRTSFTPPPNHVHPTPEPRSPHPRTTFTHNPQVTHSEPTLNQESRAAADATAPDTLTLTPDASPAAKREPTGQRLPADWAPNAADSSFATDLGLDVTRVLPGFADYWHAQPGQKGRKLDWAATWRNWCRREAERPRAKVVPLRPMKTSQWTTEEQDAELMRMFDLTPPSQRGALQ